jgi:hypothetical protein
MAKRKAKSEKRAVFTPGAAEVLRELYNTFTVQYIFTPHTRAPLLGAWVPGGGMLWVASDFDSLASICALCKGLVSTALSSQNA